jgi:hypothetical protein
MIDTNSLARFQADPAKVRVSIRKNCLVWMATVLSRASYTSSRCFHSDPVIAIDSALLGAEPHVPGVDIGMEWTHEHPFGRAGVEVRR